jgi:hypothetical protein
MAQNNAFKRAVKGPRSQLTPSTPPNIPDSVPEALICGFCNGVYKGAEGLPGNHYCKELDQIEFSKATTSPYETKLRRQAERRLGSSGKMRRMRDRSNVSGAPNLKRIRRQYGQFLHKDVHVNIPVGNVSQEFAQRIRRDLPKLEQETPQHVKYLVKRFSFELEKGTIEGVNKEVTRVLSLVREHAEKQVGKIPDSPAEREYVKSIKIYAIRQIQKSARRWQADLESALPLATYKTVWGALAEKEVSVKRWAIMATRTVLSNVYNDYTGWLLNKGGGQLYKWVNPADENTSETCQRIAAQTAEGVTYQQLKDIVQKEADKEWYRAERPLLAHPQCRSAVVLVR